MFRLSHDFFIFFINYKLSYRSCIDDWLDRIDAKVDASMEEEQEVQVEQYDQIVHGNVLVTIDMHPPELRNIEIDTTTITNHHPRAQ